MKRILCIAAALAAFLCGCGNISHNTGAAQTEVTTFHNRLNAKDFPAIISAADPTMFSATSKSDTTDFLKVVNKKLGKVTGSRTTRWNVQTFNGQTTVVLVQDTKFEKGSGTETFTVRMNNGKAQLLGYNVSLLSGLNPDSPSPDGIIHRVVQGVRIHPLHGQHPAPQDRRA